MDGVKAVLDGNGSRFWRWKKVDVLFVVGLGLIVYGAALRRLDFVFAGVGVAGAPIAIRGDKP